MRVGSFAVLGVFVWRLLCQRPPFSQVRPDRTYGSSHYASTQFNVIGAPEVPFSGVLDGNDCSISNLHYTVEDQNDVGLFRCVGFGGEIKDLVLIDPHAEQILGADAYRGKSDYSIWEGRRAQGRALMTLLRGKIIAQDGELVADEPQGKHLEGILPPGL